MGTAYTNPPDAEDHGAIVVCTFCTSEFEFTDALDFGGFAECPECGELTPVDHVRLPAHVHDEQVGNDHA